MIREDQRDPFSCSKTDQKLIEDAISDSISILRARTENVFPIAGKLTDVQFQALRELTVIEARLFYRLTAEDVMRRYIPVSSGHTMRANQPPGTRIRYWISVESMARLFLTILADDTIVDKIPFMIAYDEEHNIGHAMFLLRWREMGKI
jgi:hypothetical protein